MTIEFLGPISNHATICEPIHEAFDDQPTESVEICLQVSTFNDIIEKNFFGKRSIQFSGPNDVKYQFSKFASSVLFPKESEPTFKNLYLLLPTENLEAFEHDK